MPDYASIITYVTLIPWLIPCMKYVYISCKHISFSYVFSFRLRSNIVDRIRSTTFVALLYQKKTTAMDSTTATHACYSRNTVQHSVIDRKPLLGTTQGLTPTRNRPVSMEETTWNTVQWLSSRMARTRMSSGGWKEVIICRNFKNPRWRRVHQLRNMRLILWMPALRWRRKVDQISDAGYNVKPYTRHCTFSPVYPIAVLFPFSN